MEREWIKERKKIEIQINIKKYKSPRCILFSASPITCDDKPAHNSFTRVFPVLYF